MFYNNSSYLLADLWLYICFYTCIVYIGQTHNTPLFTTAQCRLSVLIFSRCALIELERKKAQWARERDWEREMGNKWWGYAINDANDSAVEREREWRAHKSMARSQRWHHDVAPCAPPHTSAVVLRIYLAALPLCRALNCVLSHFFTRSADCTKFARATLTQLHSQHPMLSSVDFAHRSALSHFTYSHNMHKQASDAALSQCRFFTRSAGALP